MRIYAPTLSLAEMNFDFVLNLKEYDRVDNVLLNGKEYDRDDNVLLSVNQMKFRLVIIVRANL